MDLDRRGFLRIAGTVYLSASLPFPAAVAARAGSAVAFPQGVASGDPLPDSIVLWTRALPEQPAPVELLLQVSTADDFATVVLEQSLLARQEQDYTVRAQVNKLDPGREYFYRFLASDGGSSRVGRTRTAPDPADETAFRLAFASCQNYEQGHYGGWGRLLAEDMRAGPDDQVQFVLHLGDFIYERYLNRAARGQRFWRTLPPFPDGATDGERVWAHTLADYRHLYKTYLSDPQLQDARARWPFVCTWDDHEFSNDGFRHFSTYEGEPRAEPERKRGANQAWFEYIPARVPVPDADFRIYRRLRWGKLADILLTDLRSHRSDPTLPDGLSRELGLPMDAIELVEILDAGREYNGGTPPATLPFGDGTRANPARERAAGTMLGAEQKAWFKQALADSQATWKIWGNSLPIMPLRLDLSALPFQNMHDSVISPDAWGGYPGEYRELMGWLQQSEISGLVSLSGDHHMQGAARLVLDHNDPESEAVAVDFNVTGISSTPHFYNVLYTATRDNSGFLQLVARESDRQLSETWNMSVQQGVLAALAYDKTESTALARWLAPNKSNPGLTYIDTNTNGYGLASFSAQGCAVDLVTVAPADQASPEGASEIRYTARFELAHWLPGQAPILRGPVFDGEPPFPW